jgi:cytochrome oxidase assembly protein ShyY1
MRGACVSWLRRPAWWSVLLTVAGVLLFAWLGLWQLHRADEKDALLGRFAAAAAAPVEDFAKLADAPPPDGYPRIRVQGYYLADRLYLLDNPRHDGRGGVEVYAPLRIASRDRLLLVDLGFLPGNGTDRHADIPALLPGEASLQGFYLPPPGMGFRMGGDALAQQSHWPKTSIYLDLEQVGRDLGQPLYPRVLALDADPAAIYVRQHTLDFSSMPPARHRAYAFQWFTFALAAVVIFGVLHRRRRPSVPSVSDRSP